MAAMTSTSAISMSSTSTLPIEVLGPPPAGYGTVGGFCLASEPIASIDIIAMGGRKVNIHFQWEPATVDRPYAWLRTTRLFTPEDAQAVSDAIQMKLPQFKKDAVEARVHHSFVPQRRVPEKVLVPKLTSEGRCEVTGDFSQRDPLVTGDPLTTFVWPFAYEYDHGRSPRSCFIGMLINPKWTRTKESPASAALTTTGTPSAGNVRTTTSTTVTSTTVTKTVTSDPSKI